MYSDDEEGEEDEDDDGRYLAEAMNRSNYSGEHSPGLDVGRGSDIVHLSQTSSDDDVEFEGSHSQRYSTNYPSHEPEPFDESERYSESVGDDDDADDDDGGGKDVGYSRNDGNEDGAYAAGLVGSFGQADVETSKTPLARALRLFQQRQENSSPLPGRGGRGGRASGRASKKRGGNGVLQNKPVTFHTRIRSSGYGAAATSSPSIRTRGGGTRGSGRRGGGGVRARGGGEAGLDSTAASRRRQAERLNQLVELDNPPPTQPQPQHSLASPLHNGAILGLSYSPSDGGTRIATCSVDQTVCLTRLPVARHGDDGVASFTGHTDRVTSVQWGVSSSRPQQPLSVPLPPNHRLHVSCFYNVLLRLDSTFRTSLRVS